MDLTSAQRKLVFTVVVLALAGLGAFLVTSALAPRTGGGNRGRAVGLTTPLPTSSPAFGSTPSAAPGGLGSGSPGGTDIYQWLPFNQADLTAAAGVVRRFAAAYATYTYTESPASYLRQMNGLVTAQLAAVIGRGYTTPGVAQLRTQQKQIATGSGQITAIRAFSANSITFVVAI